jgi:pyruvate/2-oxoacid:ferredoxin oxidoreductase beta subunit
MDDTIALESLSSNIDIILRQTNYSTEEAREKLFEYNNDYIAVIKAYLGVKKDAPKPEIKSVNQEIYKQMRFKLDSAMRDYTVRKDNNETRLK